MTDRSVAAPEGDGDGPPAQPPPLEGRHIRLRPVFPTDYEYLFRLATNPEVGFRWRTQGATPNPATFPETLWRDVLVQFIAENKANGEPIGLVSCFAANLREGFAHVAIVAEPRYQRTGVVLSPFLLMVNYVFSLWNFRKLYMESAHYNYVNISSGEGRLFHEEGRFKDHIFFGERFWDLHILAGYRDDWNRSKGKLLRLVLPPENGSAP